MKTPKTIWDIDRNDIAACRAYHDALGGITSDEARVMIRLQDDPAKLKIEMRTWTERKDATE